MRSKKDESEFEGMTAADFTTPPPGWVPPPPGPSIPSTKNIPQSVFDEVARAQIAKFEQLWRPRATTVGKTEFGKLRIKSALEETNSYLGDVANEKWPTLNDCIPVDSILDVVDNYFLKHTDIPRELPFFTVLHYITAMMMQEGVQIAPTKSLRILPDLWTVVLAPSGGGKSQTQKAIADALGGNVDLFPDAQSSIKFADNLKKHRLGLFLRDEFAQFLKSIKREKSMENVTDYLLRTYDNADVMYESMSSKIVVERSAISIFGTTPIATITKYLTAEMMHDGFAQRFAFIVAEKDKSRKRVALYDFDDLKPQIQPLWNNLRRTPFHKVYYIDKVGVEVFNEAFNIVLDRADAEGIDESFSRRLMWRCFKYGLAYHIITGKTDDTLHTEDLIYGARLVAMSLRDLRKIMDLFGEPPAVSHSSMPIAAVTASASPASIAATKPPVDKLAKVTAYLQKLRDSGAAPITVGKMQASVRQIKGDAVEARSLIEQAIADDPSLAPFYKPASSR
jgi:hypothetical protein